MTATAISEPVGWQSRIVPRLPRRAQLYASAVFLCATFGAALAIARGGGFSSSAWVELAVLAPLAAFAPLFSVSIGRNHAFHVAVTFTVAGALVLPSAALVVLVVLLHIPQWVKERYPWYLQTFNIANYTLSVLAAAVVADRIRGDGDAAFALGGIAAAAVFVFVNHSLLAPMLRLARGHTLRETGLFSSTSLGIDFVLASLGVAVAAFLDFNPWLVPTLLAPLLLANRSLATVAQLGASDERFRAMFDSAPAGTLLVGLDGEIMAVNRAFEEMVGYTREELADLPTGTYVHPDDYEEGRVLFDELVAGERSVYRREARYVSAAGEIVFVQIAVALVRDADARPSFAITMVEDVTERAELEERLRQAQKLEAIGRLAGGVAHDFNNMLTAIGGYNELAIERLGEDSPVRDDLEEVRKATDRATILTRQLLAFSRKQVLQPELLNLNGVVVDLEGMLRPLIGEDIELVTVFDPALGPIEADPSQLQQVVMNLVVNARDAMPGGGRITIETANADVGEGEPSIEPGRYVSLTVRDTGEGIDAETLQQIFEPFFTTKEPGKGTGLGLATVYGIVKQSGGYVSVESEPGHGTAFSVYLQRVDEARASARDIPPSVPEPQATARRETVLLVEDEDTVRRLVRQVLEQNGYAVVEARDGEEALELGRSLSVDLLLTDMVMPKLGGREVAAELRTVRPELKVIYMSGYAEGMLETGALQNGTTLLEKPFTFAALTETVRSMLDA